MTDNTSTFPATLASQTRLLILDVDGVMTDGKLYFSEQGYEMKAFNTLDGHGIKMLQKSGVDVGIITGRTSKLVTKRANDLGIRFVVQGREDKLTALEEILAEHPYGYNEIAYLGDDLPDLPVICKAGLGMAVANAHPFVAENAQWITTRRGGEGAVREACDAIMAAQGTLQAALEQYLA